ncbi:MAG: zinc-binding dehydrogenase, partial [Hyphomicrobiaceae bacterium]|nr:zinc-binding dehydrogenase [Hyphomicrobiaceae bacterium]
GLTALLAARAAGARQLMVLDRREEKLALARQMGATHTVHAAGADALDEARAISGGGVEFAFEMAGEVKALELAYAITRRGGTTVTAGLPHREHRLTLPASSLVHEERTLKGSYMGSCVPGRDIPRYICLYRQGMLPVDRLLSERIALADINEGFDRLADAGTVRQVLLP